MKLPHFLSSYLKQSKELLETHDEAQAMRLLRRMKAEAALLMAIADIGGVWPVMEVTRRQTELAGGHVTQLPRERILRLQLNSLVELGKRFLRVA